MMCKLGVTNKISTINFSAASSLQTVEIAVKHELEGCKKIYVLLFLLFHLIELEQSIYK